MPEHHGETEQARVEEWLQGQGYPAEFECALTFEKAGFTVRQGIHVKDGEKRREIDVVAAMNMPSEPVDHPVPQVSVQFLIECKYTSQPWVVLSAEKRGLSAGVCLKAVIGSRRWSELAEDAKGVSAIIDNQLVFTEGRTGFNVVESLRDNNKQDHAYGALQSVVTKARLLVEPRKGSAIAVWPVVVVKGKLYEAYWETSQHRVSVAPVPWFRMCWFGAELGADAVGGLSLVDVVTAEGLPAYVRERATYASVFLQSMHSLVHKRAGQRRAQPVPSGWLRRRR